MDPETLQKKLKEKFGAAAVARTGGKGSVRRKHKAVRKQNHQDDKKLQAQLKKLQVNPIPAIEEVNLFKDDGTIIHFVNPKVQAAIASNTYVISGEAENKKLQDLLPGIIPQLGADSLEGLRKLASSFGAAGPAAAAADDDDVPPLVENFEEASNKIEELSA
eukprot:GILI01006802.1.p1 GENE.GILI01006802.1~~GILI01006802.1.p1  ORF type:complete len:162 (-),score=59.96 GILI01006802.1:79-564(-)